MAPFRPTNINKRAYPGNANVIGPTTTATLGISTTTCCASTTSCGACACQNLCLGCICSFCACPCCNVVCGCSCTTCTKCVPSGMWSSSEQYNASIEGAWGTGVSSSNGSPTCLSCNSVGYTCVANIVDCKGYFTCCSGTWKGTSSTSGWTSVSHANSTLGSCGWFIADKTLGNNVLNLCRTYWNSNTYQTYQSTTSANGTHFNAVWVIGCTGTWNQPKANTYRSKPIRSA